MSDPFTYYADVRHLIQDGDVALMRNGGLIGFFAGPQTHAAACRWWRDENGKPMELALCESREFFGGRTVTLSSQVRAFPGRIDIYRPKCAGFIRSKAASLVSRQAGHRYGWWDLVRAAAKRIPGARLLLPAPRVSTWYEPKDCSHTVDWGLNLAGYDATPGIAPRDCEPRHLANSATMELLFRGLVCK